MVEVSRHEPGSFSWAELATSDPAAARSFYSSLFGWSAVNSPIGPEPDDVYTRMQLGGKDVAALYRIMKDQAAMGVPPHSMCYVTVSSADASAAKAPFRPQGRRGCRPFRHASGPAGGGFLGHPARVEPPLTAAAPML